MKKLRLLDLHKGQRKAKALLDEGAKWNTLVCARQWGKTLFSENMMLYWLLNNPGVRCCWISPYNAQSDHIFEEIAHEAGSVLKSKHTQKKKLWFNNHSTLEFLSAENYSAIRGGTYDYGVIDEAAFIRPEALKVIRPIFAIKGKQVLIISTPIHKNWFYEYAQLGLDPSEENYRTFKAVSTDNPYFPKQEVEEAWKTLPREDVLQEYFAEFKESGGEVFNGIAACSTRDQWIIREKAEGVYVGVDIAVGGADKTTIVVMNHKGEVLFVKRWSESNSLKQVEMIKDVLAEYNVVGGFIEINQERGIQQQVCSVYTDIEEWFTTKKNKPDLIQNLKKDIEDGAIQLPSSKLDQIMYNELSAFSKEYKANGYVAYAAPAGQHDDSVIALALANEARMPSSERFKGTTRIMGASKRKRKYR